jgi:hypothetical protein
MLSKKQRLSLKRIAIAVALCSMFSIAVHANTSPVHQDGVKAKVDNVVHLLRQRKFTEAEAELHKLGAAAIPYLLDFVRAEFPARPPAVSVFLRFIVSTESPEAESAAASLLSDKSAYMRGQTISYLRSGGARKVQQASLPYLIGLLKDNEIWLSGQTTRVVRRDPAEIEEIRFEFSVRDEAIEALQNITGITLAEKGNKDEQVKAWIQWWQSQPKQ